MPFYFSTCYSRLCCRCGHEIETFVLSKGEVLVLRGRLGPTIGAPSRFA